MKTSIKLLTFTALILLGTLVAGLFLMKKDIRSLVASQTILEYHEISAEKFDRVVISPHWQVEIRKGKPCKVEVATPQAYDSLPQLRYHNGKLQLGMRPADSLPVNLRLYARLTMPDIRELQAEGNSLIHLMNYRTDTLQVFLKDSSTYRGSGNTIEVLTITTLSRAEP